MPLTGIQLAIAEHLAASDDPLGEAMEILGGAAAHLMHYGNQALAVDACLRVGDMIAKRGVANDG